MTSERTDGDGGSLRFDGRVAIVTGAGGNPGLGRSFARLLAERGAKVVVNDLGVGPNGRGAADAAAVAREIEADGGVAIADGHSVADEDGARAIVDLALDRWGRVDVLINNAGVAHIALFDEISSEDLQRVVDVHLLGSIWMCRAAWPHMREAGYGRIVNINAGAMFGLRHVVPYGAAKGGLYGLTRGLAVEGAPDGIKVNTLAPAAGTVATRSLYEEGDWLEGMLEDMAPELIAPAVAYLAHESCEATGKYLNAAGGRLSERIFAETAGHTTDRPTIESVADGFAAVTDRSNLTFRDDPTGAETADPLGIRRSYRGGEAGHVAEPSRAPRHSPG